MNCVFLKSPPPSPTTLNVSFLPYSSSLNRNSLPSSSPKFFEPSGLLFSTTGTVVVVLRRTRENHLSASQRRSSAAAAAAARPTAAACCLCRNKTCSGRRRCCVFSEVVRWSYFPIDGEEIPPPPRKSACCVYEYPSVLTSRLPPPFQHIYSTYESDIMLLHAR